MEVFDIISTVIDLSNKGSEFNEEINELNMTIHSLQESMLVLENTRNAILSDKQKSGLKEML